MVAQVIERAHEKAEWAQAALDDAHFQRAIELGQEGWKAVDRIAFASPTAFEAWIKNSLIESQAWAYLDDEARAMSTARRSRERAAKLDPGGIWAVRAQIRELETLEWGNTLERAAAGYEFLVGALRDVRWGAAPALVASYQMISVSLKAEKPEIGDAGVRHGSELALEVGSDDLVGSFKRWHAVLLADRGRHDAAMSLLTESRALKPLDLNRRVRIGEAFPRAFVLCACEDESPEKAVADLSVDASAVGLNQYVRGAQQLLAHFGACP